MRFITDILTRVISGFVFILSAAACILACSSCSEKPTQPPPPPVTEPDTTSHDFTWTTYTLGDGQSYLNDIFAVNDTDAWAVGEMYLKDSTGSLNRKFNAAHWDGREWKLFSLPALTYFGDLTKGLELTCVFGFSKDDIWMFSIVGAYVHWDGKEWTTKFVPERTGTIKKIWGRSSSDLYFVGTNGSITHYNGRTFLPMESGTKIDLNDISGTFQNKIYACGGYLATIVLESAGDSWSSIDSLTDHGNASRTSVYAEKAFLGFGGAGIVYIDAWYGDSLRSPPMDILEGKNINGLPMGVSGLRGSSRKNVFAVGSWQYIIHYNGMSWKWYKELWDDSGHQQYGLAVTASSVFVVGQKNWRATILHGKRIK